MVYNNTRCQWTDESGAGQNFDSKKEAESYCTDKQECIGFYGKDGKAWASRNLGSVETDHVDFALHLKGDCKLLDSGSYGM